MNMFRRASLASTLVFALAASGWAAAGSALAETPFDGMSGAASGSARPTALSSADRLSYTTAFDALRRGDIEAARASARQAQDRVLLGQVEFESLFHPDHVATYDELTAWLETYSDLPCADRVYTLALRRRPDGAPEPVKPGGLLGRTWNSVVSAVSGGPAVDPMKAARIAYNNDDLTGASAVGREIGDWWTVGLAEWRLGQFHESFAAFERVANDPTEDPWVRAGAAYWTARAASQSGRQDRVNDYLRLAGQWPATFYGQIALRQLGEEPTIENMGPRAYQAEPRLQRAAYVPQGARVETGELEAFVQTDARAKRTVAYYEVGRRTEGESELRSGLRTAVGDAARMWTALARVMMSGNGGDATRIDAMRFPMPVLEPEGGFVIEKALVYALARKETDFNPDARSSAGAYGLMQVMPTTAAEMTGDRTFVTDPSKLLVPATNMRLGQAYINRMLQLPAFQGDLLRAVASYNAGPGPMLTAVRKLGPDADPLLLIETIDVPQARDYVEKVVASYWIYQRMFGGPLNTLDAVASGAKLVPVSLDYVPPAPVAEPVLVAQAATVGGGR
ncbi:MAG: lytic transglycosylase domain-containing protein [Alphaproteobacteria bacterium]|jgi:soluble lytic murein transglycosylase|uniref:Lytic transglycosylase domain-containing protein n=1 Tax=Brevundimonas mediterranea TaxID=74329 RepID=A0A6G7EJT8_9CAUL|nr:MULTISPECIES: lytic transglycosylase domain-containing protein [Brevundimonas]MBU1271511.1 lytic transglycosylase domain-containing protein [Alphaproteobacteria bacterium]OGN41743.1 MAG: transglycosylase [Caulobacterales bacterium RIFCSPHIGHO2_01_FULL_67_30]OGN43855.1 MAG: transglycosylase [Caulobacterales bacterium GWE1_67_11]OYX79622.1 MAG: transglycosylase [Brevundimonas sp. 32-68-21]EDX80068.1 Transglycosylase SLT domain protein [Brevundimonas sp. BAL3]